MLRNDARQADFTAIFQPKRHFADKSSYFTAARMPSCRGGFAMQGAQ
jgi:hypothetical protein